MAHGRYLLVLSLVYSNIWALLAIAPYDRHDWILENVLVLVAAVVLWFSYRRLMQSRISYTLIFLFLFLFLCLHAVGAHYTYAMVPYDDWFKGVFGVSFNQVMGLERNHFDRLVHFSYGLLLA